jgi:hypothetical protein
MIAAPPQVLGRTYPRLFTPALAQGDPGPCGCGCALTPETSIGFEVESFARDVLNRPLDPWQRWLVIHAMERSPATGLPRFRQVLVLVARQNGKTELLVILSLFWLAMDRVNLVLGTSTKLQYARESWKKAVNLAKTIPALNAEIGVVRNANGEEELSLSGGRYLIAASNEEGGRSLTIDRLVMDELRQQHTWDAYMACVPATNAVPDAQIWMISNAGTDKSEVLNSLRAQGLENVDPGLGVFEWSAPDGSGATDIEALAMANPNLGRRISLDSLIGQALRAEAAGGEQLAKFLTEVHCRHIPLDNPAIDMDAWDRCKGSESFDGVRDRTAMCIDISLDELHATLVAAAVVGERVRVSVVKEWSGQFAVREMTAALPDIITKVQPRKLGWFPSGPAAVAAASLVDRDGWPPDGTEVQTIRGEVTAVCMGFAEQVRSLAIEHGGDPLLDTHVRSAEKLPHGDGWRFGRRKAGYVDAVYAAAGAVHLARTLPEPPDIGLLFA